MILQRTDQLVTVRLPRRWFLGRRVELVVKKAEGFLAAEGVAGKQRTVPGREIDLDVHPVRRSSLYERCPQPIVDVRVRDVADDVAAPVYTLVEVRERLLNPLRTKQFNSHE